MAAITHRVHLLRITAVAPAEVGTKAVLGRDLVRRPMHHMGSTITRTHTHLRRPTATACMIPMRTSTINNTSTLRSNMMDRVGAALTVSAFHCTCVRLVTFQEIRHLPIL
jgi:hypothetical protein